MKRLLALICAFFLYSCNAQTDFESTLSYTSDLQNFENLSGLKDALKGVDLIALGENTHGLGEVFSAKTELVKFLYEALGFDLVLFESGYGDGALAWAQIDALSAKDFTQVFSSNFYYNSKEIESLARYAKNQNGELKLQGFDCQPQQGYLIKRMSAVAKTLDSTFAQKVPKEMQRFNQLYQFENDKDTLAFYNQRDRFTGFLSDYDSLLNKNQNTLMDAGISAQEIDVLKRSTAIFRDTYSKVEFGEMMSWPAAANLRDRAMFEIVKWFKENNPESKIIIWAQNSHIENRSKPNYNVHWMGHLLKEAYGDSYYSIGAMVYSGTNLN